MMYRKLPYSKHAIYDLNLRTSGLMHVESTAEVPVNLFDISAL